MEVCGPSVPGEYHVFLACEREQEQGEERTRQRGDFETSESLFLGASGSVVGRGFFLMESLILAQDERWRRA